VWAALGAVYLIWGSTYLGIRLTVDSIPPFVSSAARFGLAAAVLAVILRVRRGPAALRVRLRELLGAALAGVLLLTFGNGMVVLAESGPAGSNVPSGVAALLIATVPLLVVLLRAATGDRPRWPTVVGVIAGFAGLSVLVLPGGGGAAPLVKSLLVVLGAAAWSVGSLLARWVALPADPFVAAVYEMITGAAVLLGVGLARGELVGFSPASVSATSWVALAYLMLAGSLVAFTAYVWLLQYAPISLVSTYAYVNPVVAVALGALVLAEPIGFRVLAGGAVVLLGVAIVVSTERRPAGR